MPLIQVEQWGHVLTKILTTIGFCLFSVSMSGCDWLDAFQSHAGPSDSTYAAGRLAPCPESPNCVSTQSESREHSIVPFAYSKDPHDALLALRQEMLKLPGSALTKVDGNYVHFEFRSNVIRVIDDVELLLDEQSKSVQFRSGSRLGYSDWGENRRRMEKIRNAILGRI